MERCLSEIILKVEEIEYGISMDETFYLIKGGEIIGKGGISKTEDPDEVYLEWIEFSAKYQGKHLLRPALASVCDHYNAKTLVLEADDTNAKKYKHLGAEETSYDEFREMQGFRLMINSLKEERPPHLRKTRCGR